LAVVMLATLHGAPDVQEWLQLLSRDVGVSDDVRADIASILGLLLWETMSIVKALTGSSVAALWV
jgi:hypothetical protein